MKIRSALIALAFLTWLPLHAAAQVAIPADAEKRMSFYADKALQALVALAQEDFEAQEGAPLTADKTNAMRDAMSRLADAGKRSGLSPRTIAAYFDEQVQKRYVGPLPVALTGADGKLDTRLLLSGIVGRSKVKTERSLDASLLAALRAEGDRTKIVGGGAAEPQPAPNAAAEPEVEIAPEIAAIKSRITGEGATRSVVVQAGDTLGLIAQAALGDSLRYREVYALNQDVLTNPNALTVGVTLKLPAN